MKNLYLYLAAILISITCESQNLQNANWHFGENVNLSFLPDPNNPVFLSGSAMVSINEGCASVSDQDGNLLFYTNGETVWNNLHQIMVNGTGLMGHQSSAQGVIIVPRPGHPDNYYIVTINGLTGDKKGLYYSEVDMSNGVGFVVAANKNTVLKDHQRTDIDAAYNNFSEKLTSAKHGNGSDYWVITQIKGYAYSYYVHSGGIHIYPYYAAQAPVVIDATTGSSCVGQLKVSPTGQRFGIAYGTINALPMSLGAVYLGNFNNATGQIVFDANPASLPNTTLYRGLEFSPSGEYVYFAHQSKLYVSDAATGANTTLVQASGFNGDMQLALNGKIYSSGYHALMPNLMSVINTPNNGSSPGQSTWSVVVTSGSSKLSVPQWVHWQNSCPSDVTLSTPETNSSPFTYSYADYIVTNGSYSVSPTQDITMKAGSYIALQPNTYITPGSHFIAYIEECETNSSFRTRPEISDTGDTTPAIAKLSIYPNPATEYITLAVQNAVLKQVLITSLDGKTILREPVNGVEEYKIETGRLSSGVYIVNAETVSGKLLTGKLVIE